MNAAADLEAALAGTRFSGRGRVVRSVPSTIDPCRDLADRGEPAGAWVLADEQTAGRGRRGR